MNDKLTNETSNRESVPPTQHSGGPDSSSGHPPGRKPRTNNQEQAVSSSMTVRRPTGPRSPRGKERSKHNSTKHAIFANVVVLEDESRAEFDFLLNGLREDFQPVGTVEEALVEKLATLHWRYRRVLIAESAEITKVANFVDWDEECRELDGANQLLLGEATANEDEIVPDEGSGLMRHIDNPRIAAKCIELFRELRDDVEANGLNVEEPRDILAELYGKARHVESTFRHEYEVWSQTAECSEEEQKKYGYASPKKCVANALKAIDAEIKRIENCERRYAYIRSEKLKVEKLRSCVPDSHALDRLLRYETTIDRAIDRTLTQLERIQRLRLGQPIPPPIKLDVSTS